MPLTERVFFVRGDDEEEYGPVGLSELRDWVRENRAGLGTSVRLDQPDSPWLPWQEFPELVVLLAEVQSKGPIPGRPELEHAPFVSRMLAVTIDLILVFVLWFPLGYTYLSSSPQLQQDLAAQSQNPFYQQPPETPEITTLKLSFYSVLVLYLTAFVYVHGKTPGKALLRLKVVNDSGNPPHFMQCLFRAMIFVVFFQIWYVVILLMPFYYMGSQRKALHDLFSHTVVVRG